MSYVPSHIGQALISPNALCVCSAANNTSSAVGSDVQFNAAADFIGSLASLLSFSSGVITLPAGYWYFLEGSTQAYDTNFSSSMFCQYRWHVGASGQGTHGRVVHPPAADGQLSGRDEKAFLFIDATAGAVSVSLRVTGKTSVDTNGLNSTASQSNLAGMGRAIIWRLDP